MSAQEKYTHSWISLFKNQYCQGILGMLIYKDVLIVSRHDGNDNEKLGRMDGKFLKTVI